MIDRALPTGRRNVSGTERRTTIDWAGALRKYLREHHPDAEKIILEMENLNTHNPGSFDEAFDSLEARATY